MKRSVTTRYVGLAAWIVGLATVFSFNLWGDIHPLGAFERFRDKTIFDLLDYLATNILLPVGGLLIAVFVGWIMSRESTMEELGLQKGPFYSTWLFLVRFVCPVAVGAILLANLV